MSLCSIHLTVELKAGGQGPSSATSKQDGLVPSPLCTPAIFSPVEYGFLLPKTE